MAEMLEQDAINALVEKQKKIYLALSAKDKVRHMYKYVLGNSLDSKLDKLSDIYEAILDIDLSIQKDNKYYDNFMMLKSSYELKILI